MDPHALLVQLLLCSNQMLCILLWIARYCRCANGYIQCMEVCQQPLKSYCYLVATIVHSESKVVDVVIR